MAPVHGYAQEVHDAIYMLRLASPPTMVAGNEAPEALTG